MAKATVEVLVDYLDGSEAAETVQIGWNGDWRELELSKKNLASLSNALDKYWNVSRPSLGGWAIEPSPPPADDVVVGLRQGQARSQADPGLGDGQWDFGTGARSHPRRGRATIQRSERAAVAGGRRVSAASIRPAFLDDVACRCGICQPAQRVGVPIVCRWMLG
jgi:Lsr2